MFLFSSNVCRHTCGWLAPSLTVFSVLASYGKVCLGVCTRWNYKTDPVNPQQHVYISKPSLSCSYREALGFPGRTVQSLINKSLIKSQKEGKRYPNLHPKGRRSNVLRGVDVEGQLLK